MCDLKRYNQVAKIDAHLHVWRATDDARSPVRVIVPPQTDVPLDLAAETLDQHAVQRAVLVQPAFLGEDNRDIADCLAQFPDRFAGVCVVDPSRPNVADRLRAWVDRGFRGVRLRPKFARESALFGDPSTFPLWQAAHDLKVTVSVLADPQHMGQLARLAERFPQAPIVVDHLGHPDVAAGVGAPEFQRLLGLAKLGNVWLKMSGFYYFSHQRFPYADCHDLIRAAWEQFGPRRLIWGSDFPHVLLSCGYGRALELPGLALDRASIADREAMMGGNAAQLYW